MDPVAWYASAQPYSIHDQTLLQSFWAGKHKKRSLNKFNQIQSFYNQLQNGGQQSLRSRAFFQPKSFFSPAVNDKLHLLKVNELVMAPAQSLFALRASSQAKIVLCLTLLLNSQRAEVARTRGPMVHFFQLKICSFLKWKKWRRVKQVNCSAEAFLS